jgi:Xaa-Pro aminopeptidase
LTVPFSLEEYKLRLDRVREVMAREKIDLLFLSSPESMFYVSGYQAEWYQAQGPREWPPLSGLAIHVDHDKFILFDTEEETILGRYTSISTDTRIFYLDPDSLISGIVGDLKTEGWLGGTVGLEMWSYRPNRVASEMFQAALERERCRVVDGTDVVWEVRAIKSPQEQAYIETAAHIADIGMQAAIDHTRPGVSELDVYAEIVYAMAKAGGENSGLPVLVLAGPRSCSHGLASRRKIMPGEIVVFDICGVYNRYHGNIARTLSMGESSPAVAEQIDKSSKSVDVLKETIRPNLPVAELNATMEKYYRDAGIWEDQWWVGGYEFGIGFPPDWVGPFVYAPGRDPGDRVFRPGEVVNFESMFYLPENAGVSWLINTIMYTEADARLLSKVPSKLIVIE